MHPAFVISTFLHPSLKALNGMAVSAASKVCLDDYILDLMVGATVAGGDSSDGESDGDDNKEAVVVPAVENAMTRIIQENITKRDDNSLSSKYSIREECKDEIRNYKRNIARVPMKGKFPDAIGRWKKYKKHLPLPGALAHKYLSIQATSAPSERIFSFAGRIIEDCRTRLDDPDTAGKLLYVAGNYEWIWSK